jgi:hypothetical protein
MSDDIEEQLLNETMDAFLAFVQPQAESEERDRR